MQTAIERAIQLAGNKSRLAKIAGVHRNAIPQWTRIPAERVLRIEAALGIPRHELRPDLYPERNPFVK